MLGLVWKVILSVVLSKGGDKRRQQYSGNKSGGRERRGDEGKPAKRVGLRGTRNGQWQMVWRVNVGGGK